MCTDGYVPYGWQFEDENIYIPSKKAAKLNIFGMITKKNNLQQKNPSMQTSLWIILTGSLFWAEKENGDYPWQCFCS